MAWRRWKWQVLLPPDQGYKRGERNLVCGQERHCTRRHLCLREGVVSLPFQSRSPGRKRCGQGDAPNPAGRTWRPGWQVEASQKPMLLAWCTHMSCCKSEQYYFCRSMGRAVESYRPASNLIESKLALWGVFLCCASLCRLKLFTSVGRHIWPRYATWVISGLINAIVQAVLYAAYGDWHCGANFAS